MVNETNGGVYLKGLGPKSFQHDSDRALLNMLEGIPLMGKIVGALVDRQKRTLELNLIGNALKVGPEYMPDLDALYCDTARRLGMSPPFPPLYVEWGDRINAYTTGADQAYVCLASESVSELSEGEMRFVMGHELGHVLCDHVRYNTLVRLMAIIGLSIPVPGVGQLVQVVAGTTILPLLNVWSRRAEFSCDRAGLLACQDPVVGYTALLKLAGLPRNYYSRPDVDQFLKQSDDFRESATASVWDRIAAFSNAFSATHPRIVERTAALKLWHDDGCYSEIVDIDESGREQLELECEGDPWLGELKRTVTECIISWAQCEFKTDRPGVATPIRRMIRGGTKPGLPPCSLIHHIELLVEKTSPTEVKYIAALLHQREGKPIRTKLEVPFSTDWQDTPREIRHSFMQTGESTCAWILYTAK